MKIVQSRIAVIIGKNGETKHQIEDRLGVNIILDSTSGHCEIKTNVEAPNYNPLNIFIAEKILNAINRGFNPIKAMKLFEETYDLEIFNLQNILGRSEKKIKRMKGRIIGRNGEMRQAIERYANCHLSVLGKTISIIADYDSLQIARKSVSMLLNGIPHHTVMKFLETRYNEKKKEEFRKLYKPEF
ncbi:MAG: RNA-processing protein [Candidatus Lokiarchaeota archaeon]|nr:RNA-processing protein [Candidatus Lokiarchaeota archaeon]